MANNKGGYAKYTQREVIVISVQMQQDIVDLAKRDGISKSEVARRALEMYFKKVNKAAQK